MKNTDELECNFYDTATMREDLVSAAGVQYNIELRDCKDWYNVGARVSGVYEVNWMGRMRKNVRCNMQVDGGGWTVFQRRYQPLTTDFNLDWNAYKQGFGDVYKEFWLGNDLIHEITSSRPHYILVLGKNGGETFDSKHGSFFIDDESESYRIHFNETLLTETHSLTGLSNQNINGMIFSTEDDDNDLYSGNCAGDYGPFWHRACANTHPNRKDIIRWESINGNEGIQEMEIMFKTM